MNKDDLIEILNGFKGNPNVVIMDNRLNEHFASMEGTPEGITHEFQINSFRPINDEGHDMVPIISIEHSSDRHVHAVEVMDRYGHGVDLIACERMRQIGNEGWTPSHDDEHDDGEMANAAACYAIVDHQRSLMLNSNNQTIISRIWPFAIKWWKPTPDDRIRELAKAGALIAAEIDRLKRSE